MPNIQECPNCGGDIAIRNPTGKCDHLRYPENVPHTVSENCQNKEPHIGCSKGAPCFPKSSPLNWRERFDETFAVADYDREETERHKSFIESLLLSQIETVLSGGAAMKRELKDCGTCEGCQLVMECEERAQDRQYNQGLIDALLFIKKVGGNEV